MGLHTMPNWIELQFERITDTLQIGGQSFSADTVGQNAPAREFGAHSCFGFLDDETVVGFIWDGFCRAWHGPSGKLVKVFEPHESTQHLDFTSRFIAVGPVIFGKDKTGKISSGLIDESGNVIRQFHSNKDYVLLDRGHSEGLALQSCSSTNSNFIQPHLPIIEINEEELENEETGEVYIERTEIDAGISRPIDVADNLSREPLNEILVLYSGIQYHPHNLEFLEYGRLNLSTMQLGDIFVLDQGSAAGLGKFLKSEIGMVNILVHNHDFSSLGRYEANENNIESTQLVTEVELKDKTSWDHELSLSSDGQMFSRVCENGMIEIRNSNSLEIVRCVEAPNGKPSSICISPSNSALVCCDHDMGYFADISEKGI